MKKKDGKKKMVKRIVALGVTAAILFGAGFGVWYLVFRDDKTTGTPLVQEAQIGTIQSTVQGNGSAVPKESASITLSAAGTVPGGLCHRGPAGDGGRSPLHHRQPGRPG